MGDKDPHNRSAEEKLLFSKDVPQFSGNWFRWLMYRSLVEIILRHNFTEGLLTIYKNNFNIKDPILELNLNSDPEIRLKL